jgi:hypothetical protein
MVLKYFTVLWNNFKTNKNPDENPGLPMDFEKILTANQKSKTFYQMFVIAKKKSRTLGKKTIG